MDNNDIYKFRDLVAKASQPKQQVTESDIRFEGTAEEAGRMASELEQYVEDIERSFESIEHIVKRGMPREYKYLESYTFAHFKTLIGGYGYTDRMNTSLREIIDQLRDYAESGDDEYDDEEV